jgi:ABC-type glutathione transport system ATPase component
MSAASLIDSGTAPRRELPPPLLAVSLCVNYRSKPGTLHNVELSMSAGEILAVVGESGSGKSTLALAILGLLGWRGGETRGSVLFEGRDILKLPEKERRALRGSQIALVPQSPLAALNPALRLHRQFEEAWRAHSSSGAMRERLCELLRRVRLPDNDSFLDRYPRELSVGMAQRVMIAMALFHRPKLLVADEPTSALDAITQREILDLFAGVNREYGAGVLFISHDLLSVARLAHRVAILCQGKIVESGATRDIFENPAETYTRKLIGALPANPFL